MSLRPHAVLVAVVVLAITACSDNGGSPTPTPDLPAASATPTGTLSPESTPTASQDSDGETALTILEPASLQPGLVLFLARGCWGCDGPTDSVERLYTDAAGEVRRDVLFTAPSGSIFGGPVFADDGAVYMSTCSSGFCGYLGAPSPDAATTIFRSLDGGMTWEERGTVAGPAAVAFAAGNDLVLDTSTFGADGSARWSRSYAAFPSGEPLTPPPGREGAHLTAMWLNQQILWHDLEAAVVVDPGGSVIYDLATIVGVDAATHRILLSAYGEDLVLSSFRLDGSGDARTHVMHAGDADIVLELQAGVSFGLASPLVHTSRAFGNLYVSVDELRNAWESSAAGAAFLGESSPDTYQHSLPAMFDLWAATAQPLMLFGEEFGAGYIGNRNFLVRAVEGSFLRVETGDDDCLNVREEPSIEAPVVGCYASGVLLADLNESDEVDGAVWRKVATPPGLQGWASDEFLER